MEAQNPEKEDKKKPRSPDYENINRATAFTLIVRFQFFFIPRETLIQIFIFMLIDLQRTSFFFSFSFFPTQQLCLPTSGRIVYSKKISSGCNNVTTFNIFFFLKRILLCIYVLLPYNFRLHKLFVSFILKNKFGKTFLEIFIKNG